jgi:uncharacterized protein
MRVQGVSGIFLLLTLLGISGAHASTKDAVAHRPSFSCVSTTPVEALICSSPDLADRDRTMAVLYAAARVSALGSGVSPEVEAQRKWLRERNDGCATEDMTTGSE